MDNEGWGGGTGIGASLTPDLRDKQHRVYSFVCMQILFVHSQLF